MKLKLTKLRTFFRLMLSYVLIFLIPISVFIASSLVVVKSINADIMKVTEEQYAQGIRMFEWKLQDMQKMVFQLTINYVIQSYLDKNGADPVEFYDARQISSILKDNVFMNTLIKNCYIYFPKSNTVINKDSVFSFGDFYNYFFKFENLSQDEWYLQYLNKYTDGKFIPKSKVFMDGRNEAGVFYIKSIGTPKEIKGVIVVLLDDYEIRKFLTPITERYSGFTCAIDENSRIMFASKEDDLAAGLLAQAGMDNKQVLPKQKNYTVIRSSSNFNGWKYISVLDTAKVFSKSNTMVSSVFWLTFLLSGLGLAFIIRITFKRFKPITAMISKIEEHFSDNGAKRSKDVYKVIEGGLDRFSLQNNELKGVIEEQKSLIKINFHRRLISGELATQASCENEAQRLGISLPEGYSYICLIYLETVESPHGDEVLKGLETVMEAMHKRMAAMLYDREFVWKKGMEQFVLFLCADAIDADAVKQRLNNIRQQLQELFEESEGCFFSITAGSPYCGILEISRSYNEANEVYAYKSMAPHRDILLYSEMPKDQEAFYYPSEVELDLIRYVRMANSNVVGSILERIIDENLNKRSLPLTMLKYLNNELCGTALRLIEQMESCNEPGKDGLKNRVLQLYKEGGSMKNFYKIREVFIFICSEIDRHKKSRNFRMKDAILEYLDKNYSSADICLRKVGDVFKINESYLSNFFKEQTGENFSDYVEALRIKHASELLKAGKYTVENVAEIVGYSNQYTFRRAFKRVRGCSPSEFKKSGV